MLATAWRIKITGNGYSREFDCCTNCAAFERTETSLLEKFEAKGYGAVLPLEDKPAECDICGCKL
jgi:hypothetical protein